MSQIKDVKNKNKNEEGEVSIFTVLGVVIICFAGLPFLYGLKMMNLQTIMYSSISIFVGIIFMVTGSFIQKKKSS
ncbi:MAG: hypothetical protein A2015_14845 [Spirochaetes bacterium GWF1_31_7]|nr:MAG: hypothetical protein A2Y30_12105 [Spirochaetes bacterium GWE1_32_154]OHD49426.1 MAG: hypothetical protein A2015_14845 [Spirochaetes bacterium GWF1_31_7]OHD51553.1 MAG: hypothetical protein A2Y29_15335 [Spirochaetes bacterium GWE2_31_10]OHD80711.1 MAG: hypothetical protein A2355_16790 [Spirochaetes bacterium RIFOXYB1_FULL_32_8]HBD93621.1 hypothetical protein [Spirochaetia bacterium]